MSSLKRMKIIFVVFIVSFLFCFSVSASEIGHVNSWGFAERDISNGGNYVYSAVTNYFLWGEWFNSQYFAHWFSFDVQNDYTYTYKFKFRISDGCKISVKMLGFSNSKCDPIFDIADLMHDDKIMYSIVSDSDIAGQYVLTISFNSNISSIPCASPYFYLLMQRSTDDDAIILFENCECTLVYDPNGNVYQQDIVNTIAKMQQQNNEFYTNAIDVMDDIKSGQQQTNQKIDEIPDKIDNILEKRENMEKQHATSGGNDNINAALGQLSGMINVASLTDVIQPLIDACSYNGITSIWTFPSIKLPAISGVMGEIKLCDAVNFDLCAYAEQYIPDVLINIVRAICTIGLIIWAVREIMGVVTNVFGGGRD